MGYNTTITKNKQIVIKFYDQPCKEEPITQINNQNTKTTGNKYIII